MTPREAKPLAMHFAGLCGKAARHRVSDEAFDAARERGRAALFDDPFHVEPSLVRRALAEMEAALAKKEVAR